MKKQRRLNPNAHLPPTQTGAPLWPQANPKAFLFHSVDALPLGVFRFLFGLLLREIPESARPETLSAFNDIISAVEGDDAFHNGKDV